MKSKEQTPIEQILRTTLVIDNPKGIKYAVEKLEAHLNAKVLEALERVQSDIGEWVPRHMRLKEKQFDEKEKQFTKGRIDCMMQISSHIETEVKPKYVSGFQ
jgi:hypothetical protein